MSCIGLIGWENECGYDKERFERGYEDAAEARPLPPRITREARKRWPRCARFYDFDWTKDAA